MYTKPGRILGPTVVAGASLDRSGVTELARTGAPVGILLLLAAALLVAGFILLRIRLQTTQD